MGRSQLVLVAALMLAGCSLIDAAGGGADGGGSSGGDRDGAAGGGDAAAACRPIIDDFEDGVVADDWVAFNDEDAVVSEELGQLRIDFNGTQEAWAGYDLRDRIDFTEGEVRVEVGTAGGMYTGFDLCFGDQELEFYVDDQDTLIGEVYGTDALDDLSEIPYLPGVHAIWRIRASQGVVYWEVSQLGDDWQLVHMQEAPFPLDDVTVTIEAAGTSGEPPASFDSFTALPTGCGGE